MIYHRLYSAKNDTEQFQFLTINIMMNQGIIQIPISESKLNKYYDIRKLFRIYRIFITGK